MMVDMVAVLALLSSKKAAEAALETHSATSKTEVLVITGQVQRCPSVKLKVLHYRVVDPGSRRPMQERATGEQNALGASAEHGTGGGLVDRGQDG